MRDTVATITKEVEIELTQDDITEALGNMDVDSILDAIDDADAVAEWLAQHCDYPSTILDGIGQDDVTDWLEEHWDADEMLERLARCWEGSDAKLVAAVVCNVSPDYLFSELANELPADKMLAHSLSKLSNAEKLALAKQLVKEAAVSHYSGL